MASLGHGELSDSLVYIWDPNLFITVPADDLAPNGARSLAGTMLTRKFMFTPSLCGYRFFCKTIFWSDDSIKMVDENFFFHQMTSCKNGRRDAMKFCGTTNFKITWKGHQIHRLTLDASRSITWTALDASNGDNAVALMTIFISVKALNLLLETFTFVFAKISKLNGENYRSSVWHGKWYIHIFVQTNMPSCWNVR